MILLDTHEVVFLAVEPERLSRAATRAIARAETRDGMAIASITLWEITMLIDRGSIAVPGSTEVFRRELCQRPGLAVLDLSPDVAALSTQYPPDFPNDPADRIIAATSRAHRLPLVTRDRWMHDSPLLRTIW